MNFFDSGSPMTDALNCIFATFMGTIIIVFIQKMWKLRKDNRAVDCAQKENKVEDLNKQGINNEEQVVDQEEHLEGDKVEDKNIESKPITII